MTAVESRARVLLVDDDPQSLDSTRRMLEFSGYEVVPVTDGQAALEKMRPAPVVTSSVGTISEQAESVSASRFDLVLSDVRMPRLGGLEFLRALSLCGETTPVILMTAFGRVEDAVWAMKLGAVDFLTKPFKRQALLESVESALKRARLRARSDRAAEVSRIKDGELASLLLGTSAPMRELRAAIAQVAPTSATVLLTGESGTGKELVARCLHQLSPRNKARFIGLNCAAVPENLIESELFGYEKGAFTGAMSAKAGLFEAADGGTLLLDEIGDMPLPLQATLLRTLQESEVRRVGSTVSKRVDVRLIAATHRNLREGSRSGAFRADLLYRLEVISLTVPSLRERREDIPELVSHFVQVSAKRHGREVVSVSEETLACLLAHDWPGNVRELANVVERAIVFARGSTIEVSDLPSHLSSLAAEAAFRAPKSGASRTDSHGAQGALGASVIEVPLGTALKDVEDLLIRKTLEATDGDKNMTARLLGINSRTIYRKLDGTKKAAPVPPPPPLTTLPETPSADAEAAPKGEIDA